MSDDNNRVLVVDDEPAVLSVIEAILTGCGVRKSRSSLASSLSAVLSMR